MNATTPVERVAKVLELAQFRRVPSPLEIGGIEIGALAAFVGKPPSPDLVVVGDTLQQTPGALQQSVEGVGRALDMVGPRPDSTAITALARYARVLPVGELADESALANWLAVLLPLKPPKTNDGRAEAAIVKLLAEPLDPLVREFVALAAQSNDSVAARLAQAIDQPFLPIEPADQGGPNGASS